MKPERTPEEKAEIRAIHSGFQVAGGVAFVACALAGGYLLFGGKAAAPNWLFGGAPAAPRGGRWSNRACAVDFAEWGSSPFARARREGKLVLLFLGPEYSAATKRAAAETFGDPGVAAMIAARFIPVRVDSAASPDLDRRYRVRGWPTVALLTSDGDLVDAGSSMAPETFLRWAGAVADRAADPGRLARLTAESVERRREAAAALTRVAAPPTPREAEGRALQLLLSAWDPKRRTFDVDGPRFPRFERAAALGTLKAAWAQELSSVMTAGDWLFLDPRDGGARRSAGPDGEVLAREETAQTQAAALDAFCPDQEVAARRVLGFVSGPFSPKDAPPRYLGWIGGYALTKNFFEATDGPDLEQVAHDGWRPLGPAVLGDEAELARAVLTCRAASAADRARAFAVVGRAAKDFNARARVKDVRLLLDDALGVGAALIAAGRIADASRVRGYVEENLSAGSFYWDRRATGVLPPETDRVADPALNARALAFLQRLAAALPAGAQRDAVKGRAAVLLAWLAARADALDPAVWAALIAGQSSR
jgi:hypothetical protein